MLVQYVQLTHFVHNIFNKTKRTNSICLHCSQNDYMTATILYSAEPSLLQKKGPPSEPNELSFDSSVKITWLQNSFGLLMYSLAYSNLLFTLTIESNGFSGSMPLSSLFWKYYLYHFFF